MSSRWCWWGPATVWLAVQSGCVGRSGFLGTTDGYHRPGRSDGASRPAEDDGDYGPGDGDGPSPACRVNGDCAETCVAGICTRRAPQNGLCDDSTDCAVGFACFQGSCSLPIETGLAASWVLVGDDARVTSSADGLIWVDRDVSSIFALTDEISAVAYGAGLWIIAGAQGKMAYSGDAATWHAHDVTDVAGTATIRQIRYDPGARSFLMVTNTGTISTSPDGLTWTPGVDTACLVTNQTNIAFGVDGWYLGCRDGVRFSPDGGATWQTVLDDDYGWYGVAYGEGIMVATSQPTVHTEYYSLDGGRSWSAADYGTWTQRPAYGNGVFVLGRESYAEPVFYATDVTASPAAEAAPFSPAADGCLVVFADGAWVVPSTVWGVYSTVDLTAAWSHVTVQNINIRDAAYGGVHNTPDEIELPEVAVVAGATAYAQQVHLRGFGGALRVFAGNGAAVCVSDADEDVTNGCTTGWMPGGGSLAMVARVASGDRLGLRVVAPATPDTAMVVTVRIGTRELHWRVHTLP